MTARAVLLVVVVAVLLIASVGAVIRCEGSPPQLAGPSDVELGRAGDTITVEIRDEQSGLRDLRAVLVTEKGKSTLAERTFPGDLLLGSAEGKEPVVLELVLEPKALGLKEGEALLRVSARDWSWRGGLEGNEDVLEIPLRVEAAERADVRAGREFELLKQAKAAADVAPE